MERNCSSCAHWRHFKHLGSFDRADLPKVVTSLGECREPSNRFKIGDLKIEEWPLSGERAGDMRTHERLATAASFGCHNWLPATTIAEQYRGAAAVMGDFRQEFAHKIPDDVSVWLTEFVAYCARKHNEQTDRCREEGK